MFRASVGQRLSWTWVHVYHVYHSNTENIWEFSHIFDRKLEITFANSDVLLVKQLKMSSHPNNLAKIYMDQKNVGDHLRHNFFYICLKHGQKS